MRSIMYERIGCIRLRSTVNASTATEEFFEQVACKRTHSYASKVI